MQLYVSRKIEYLKSQGWTPLVYFYSEGQVEIPNLKEYKSNYIPNLRICVGNVSAKIRAKVLGTIAKDLNHKNKIIIESCCLALGTWGEFLANKLHGKHILYIVDEFVAAPTKKMSDFIKYKIEQKLFYCIDPDIIKKHIPELANPKDIILVAVGCSSNNVVDYDNELIDNLPEKGLSILSLGRLDKGYIEHLFDSIANFARWNTEKDFNFIVVGDAPNRRIRDKLFQIVANIKNLNVFELGAIWPLPLSLFRKVKVAVGSAGSILLCSKHGVPSISIDSNDHEAIGILRVNTNNVTFRNNEDPKYDILFWLKHILIDEQICKMNTIEDDPLDYSAHQKIIDIKFNNNYFPTETSRKFTSHPYTRSLLIKFDQTKIGHYIIHKFWTTEFIKKLIWRFNN